MKSALRSAAPALPRTRVPASRQAACGHALMASRRGAPAQGGVRARRGRAVVCRARAPGRGAGRLAAAQRRRRARATACCCGARTASQFAVATYAALRADAVVVPVNAMWTAEEARHVVDDSGARVAIVAAEFAPRLATALADGLLRDAVADRRRRARRFAASRAGPPRSPPMRRPAAAPSRRPTTSRCCPTRRARPASRRAACTRMARCKARTSRRPAGARRPAMTCFSPSHRCSMPWACRTACTCR